MFNARYGRPGGLPAEHDDSEMIATRPVAPEDASLTQLERWTQLRDQGVLTEEELQAQKRMLLGE